MSQQNVNENDTGLVARSKINENFSEVYGAQQTGWLSGGTYLGAIVIGESQTDLTDNQVLFFGAPCLRRISRGWGGTAPPDIA